MMRTTRIAGILLLAGAMACGGSDEGDNPDVPGVDASGTADTEFFTDDPDTQGVPVAGQGGTPVVTLLLAGYAVSAILSAAVAVLAPPQEVAVVRLVRPDRLCRQVRQVDVHDVVRGLGHQRRLRAEPGAVGARRPASARRGRDRRAAATIPEPARVRRGSSF